MSIQKENMIKGKPYIVDETLKNEIYDARRKVREFNSSITREEIQEKARELFGSFGENSSVTPPFRCDYGSNIHIGNNVYMNYNTSILDVAPVTIKDNTMIGPDCGFYTPEHPIDKDIRNEGIEFGKPIVIEESVWLGGNVTVLGGVTIGEGSIVGAGSVVKKDIPAGVIAAGNPCRVIREITDEDRTKWISIYEDFKTEHGLEDRNFL